MNVANEKKPLSSQELEHTRAMMPCGSPELTERMMATIDRLRARNRKLVEMVRHMWTVDNRNDWDISEAEVRAAIADVGTSTPSAADNGELASVVSTLERWIGDPNVSTSAGVKDRFRWILARLRAAIEEVDDGE